MKKQLSIVLLASLLLSGCDSLNDYTSFKEYTEIVKNATEGQKDIFFFTASNCSSCQALAPLLKKFIAQSENKDYNVYVLSVDYKIKLDGTTIFQDKTMGYISGNVENDCIKALDNRISKYVDAVVKDVPIYLFKGDENASNYSYVYTPLILWYDSGLEVKVANQVVKSLPYDEKGNPKYDAFVEFMKFPEQNPAWYTPFDLDYYDENK